MASWVNIGLGNGMLPYDSKSLPEPMLTYKGSQGGLGLKVPHPWKSNGALVQFYQKTPPPKLENL